MSAFSGKQARGAMSIRRQVKHEEAVERNAKTKPERCKAARKAANK